MNKKPRIFLPNNSIELLCRRPGGIPRKDAIKGAIANIEGLRDESIAAIQAGIEAIEVTTRIPEGDRLSLAEMETILRLGNRIVLLSEIFGLAPLLEPAMFLCDLTARLIEIPSYDPSPLRVFARALRLTAPLSPDIDELNRVIMGNELSRLLVYYGVSPEQKKKAVS